MRVDIEGHGREPLDGFDVTRTVGWFTTLFIRDSYDPGSVDLSEAMAGGPAAGLALKQIKEQLRSLPQQGLGYGLLRYVDDETATVFKSHPVPAVAFNYLGRDDVRTASAWHPAPEAGKLNISITPNIHLN